MSRPLPKYLASREFVMSVIEDMRAALANPGYVLDMQVYAGTFNNKCHVCAGGSAVVFGLGGPMNEDAWSADQWDVARWCDAVRRGWWDRCVELGHPVPEAAQNAWYGAMMDADEPDFFPAWERFANALPTESELMEAKR